MNETASSHGKRHIEVPPREPSPYFSDFSDTPFLYRKKASCACGGGCPSCATRSSGVEVSQPGDAAEIEADNIAGRVMRMAAGRPLPPESVSSFPHRVRRKCSACDDGEVIRRKTSSSGDIAGDSGLSSLIGNATGSGGLPLEGGVRNFFEPKFGYDFSGVRIHTGGPANEAARAVDAHAYTLGSDIVFAAGMYAPGSPSGDRLLAHELAHVVQSSVPGARGPAVNGDSTALKIQRAPNTPAPPPPAPAPPVWLGSLGTGAVWMQGEIWEVNAPSLGGKVWIGPYSQLTDYINKQGFAGTMEAAHIVGGEHLDDVGSAFSYNNAPCVAVDKTLHASWTANTTTLQRDHLGGRSSVSSGRTIITGQDAIWLYDQLYEAHPELQGISRAILNLPGRDAGGSIVPKPAGVMPGPVSPMDAHQGSPVPKPGSPMDAHQGSPVPRAGSPMDAHQGSPVPRAGSPMDAHQGSPMPGAGSPMDAHQNFQMPKPPAAGDPGHGPGGGGPPASGFRANLGAAGAVAAHSALNFGAEMVGGWVRQNQLEDIMKNEINPKLEAEKARQAEQLFRLQIENGGIPYYWNITIETGTIGDTAGMTGTGNSYPKIISVAISDQKISKSKTDHSFWPPGAAIQTTTTTYSEPAGSVPMDKAAIYGRLTGMKLDKLRQRAVAARDTAGMPDQYDHWADVVAMIDADDLDLVLRAQTERLSADLVRAYFAIKAEQAEAAAAAPRRIDAVPQLSDRPRELLALVDAPFGELILFTKRWGNRFQLGQLRAYAATRVIRSGRDTDSGAGPASSAYWSEMAGETEAPLEDEYLADRQRFVWSQGTSADDLAGQLAKVNSIEKRIGELERRLEQLNLSDARTREEYDAGEPPHPPWGKIGELKQEIKRVREDLSVERQLLKSYEREKR